ncbi:unnamed protein product [Meganyctiphanes norvegica]|uniref:Uncharacterized protein n=1 Tax=Meganyctiphanes norvegica TaxID=48144 RepID=A0AAV2SJ93_MEGNR
MAENKAKSCTESHTEEATSQNKVNEKESNKLQKVEEQNADNSKDINNSKVDLLVIPKMEENLENEENVKPGEIQLLEKVSEKNSNTEIEENSEVESSENQTKGMQYNNPVFRKISKINGEINKMNKLQLKNRLRDLNQDNRGHKDVLIRRLKQYYRNRTLSNANIRDPDTISWFFDNFVVIDYEATCEGDKPIDYRHEIIEFPAVIVNSKTRKIVSEFHSYVRPVINPKLSDFCTSLTGITQDKVNFAPEFSKVLSMFELWLHENNLTFEESGSRSFTIITDGPWDMGRFLIRQCSQSKIQFPKWALRWINIRKTYSNFYKTKRLNLSDMLENLDMKFEGRPHCGKDDARNIARIASQLLKDGCNLRYNERIQLGKDGKADLSHSRIVFNVSRREFDRLRGIKSSDMEEVESDEEVAAQLKGKPVLDTESRDDFPCLVAKK